MPLGSKPLYSLNHRSSLADSVFEDQSISISDYVCSGMPAENLCSDLVDVKTQRSYDICCIDGPGLAAWLSSLVDLS